MIISRYFTLILIILITYFLMYFLFFILLSSMAMILVSTLELSTLLTFLLMSLSTHLTAFGRSLQMGQPGSSFLSELKQKLLLPPSEAASAGTRYNVPLINSLVLYVGMQVISNFELLCSLVFYFLEFHFCFMLWRLYLLNCVVFGIIVVCC